MALRFVMQDVSFFRNLWNWEDFIERYHGKGCDLQKHCCNQISSLLFKMTLSQEQRLYSNISKEIYFKTNDLSFVQEELIESKDIDETFINWKFKSNEITSIEGIFLPIYSKSVMDFFESRNDIVKVESTKINLKSLAFGISSGRAICLTGGVGCGKTSLVEYMAKAVGRLSPNQQDYNEYLCNEKKSQINGNKRKLENIPIQKNLPKSGFLRVQLGDQTDSKVLLGQYRCTDTPGEFTWQPGVLTQAVMNGDWLLLEDIDLATQDVCTVLANLLENNFLSVPGFREYLQIEPGFQIFVTLR
jgi:midasin